MANEEILDDETIRAAVAGKQWALEKVLQCYSSEIDRHATVRVRQPDGSVREEIDEDLRQSIVLTLLQEIPNFPIDDVPGKG